MPRVPAGNITGIYYIVVAGLPWQCSWQRLKDFARNQQADGTCFDIDHAMVYPDSTDGWVRVKGIDIFKKTLGNGIFHFLPILVTYSLTACVWASSFRWGHS